MSTPRPTPLYRTLRRMVRSAVGVFYNTVEATGLEHLRGLGPTILAPTHPNSIIDPLLVGLFEERQISFVARHGLFKVPLLGAVLRASGAIPIHRRSEGDASANTEAFAECRRVLQAGGVLAIFPEGKTHSRLRVEPVKTGLARIALDAEDLEGAPRGLRIVPVGLNYLVRHAFRSDVHVAFGEPLALDDALRALALEDQRAAVRDLTERVQRALEALTIHIEHAEDERLIAQVTAIIVGVRVEGGLDEEGQGPAERVALARRIVDATRWLDREDPPRSKRLRTRLSAFLEEREALGLGGERPALQHRGERRILRGRHRLKGATFLVLGAPLAAYGLLSVVAPYLVLRLILSVARPTFYRAALVKLLGGTALFAALWVAQTALVIALVGAPIGVGYALSLLPASLVARRYLSEIGFHRLGPRFFFRRLWYRRRIAALHAERKALTADLAAVRRDYFEHLGEPLPEDLLHQRRRATSRDEASR